jgi:hypothetical protein
MCVLKECGDAAVIVVVAAEAHHQEFRRRVAQSRGPESAVTRVCDKDQRHRVELRVSCDCL